LTDLLPAPKGEDFGCSSSDSELSDQGMFVRELGGVNSKIQFDSWEVRDRESYRCYIEGALGRASMEGILEDYPNLKEEDVRAALIYTAELVE